MNHRDEWGWSGGSLYPRGRDLAAALRPLCDVLAEYDDRRVALEQRGGELEDLAALTRRLRSPFTLSWKGVGQQAHLADPRGLRDALGAVAGFDVSLQVRELDTGMPVYYLCRTRQDWWSEYGLVVEDFYQSPGYPMPDRRIVRLLRSGHESGFIRLSPYRAATAALLAGAAGAEVGEGRIDALLLRLGRHVFASAWHEDQRLGVLAAEHLRMDDFAQAIELVYLALSGDACELRSAIGPRDLVFFDRVYPRPALRALLERVGELDGGGLGELPARALAMYRRLAGAFAALLAVQVPWAAGGAVCLRTLLFANCGRFDEVAAAVRDSTPVAAGVAALEGEARQVIDGLLGAGASS
jgi:hypothetical protein